MHTAAAAAADTDCDQHHGHSHEHPEPFDHSDDGCAICKMAAGQLGHFIAPPQVPLDAPNSHFLPRATDADVPASPSIRRAQGRAPPRFS